MEQKLLPGNKVIDGYPKSIINLTCSSVQGQEAFTLKLLYCTLLSLLYRYNVGIASGLYNDGSIMHMYCLGSYQVKRSKKPQARELDSFFSDLKYDLRPRVCEICQARRELTFSWDVSGLPRQRDFSTCTGKGTKVE